MRPDRVIVLPMLVVGVALLRVAPVLWLAALALTGTAVGLLLAGRFVLTRNEQAMVGVVALSVGILVPRALATEALPMGAVSDGMYALGLAAQLSAVVRLYVRAPVGGAPVTGALGLVALAAAGGSSLIGEYPAFIALFLLTSAWAVAAGDPGRPRLRRLGARHLLALLVIVGATSAFVAATQAVLPPAHARLIARLMRGMSARTGFTEYLSLGEMRGMVASSRLVARVRGAPVDHLRGVVLRTYAGGRWDAEGHTPRGVLEVGVAPPPGPTTVDLEFPGSVASYFVPLGADALWASSGFAEVEKQGILRPSRQHRAKRVAFQIGEGRATPGGVSDPPGDLDRRVPSKILADLHAVLGAWGAEGVAPREAVDIIRARLLSDYTYSLEFRRTARLDPVIDFLTVERRGHCEYFATAAALLARTAGLPARVIGGYRVTERSPLADYAIVRERDAHAWAEVYLDGHWETLDATPGGPLGALPETPPAQALLDLLSTGWERVDDWLAQRTQLELSGILVALLMAFVAYRVWLSRSTDGPAHGPVDLPLPDFSRLAKALEAAGVPARAPAEPIEVWARKVRASELDRVAADRAADALADYAALRYGAPRDEAAVLERLAAALVAVEHRAARPSASR